MPLFTEQTMETFERLRGEERELVERVQKENIALRALLGDIVLAQGGRMVVPGMARLHFPDVRIYREPMQGDTVIVAKERR